MKLGSFKVRYINDEKVQGYACIKYEQVSEKLVQKSNYNFILPQKHKNNIDNVKEE